MCILLGELLSSVHAYGLGEPKSWFLDGSLKNKNNNSSIFLIWVWTCNMSHVMTKSEFSERKCLFVSILSSDTKEKLYNTISSVHSLSLNKLIMI